MKLVDVIALKKFPYSENGTAIKQAKPGDTIRVKSAAVAGMKAAGMIDDEPAADVRRQGTTAIGGAEATLPRQDGPTIEEYVKAGYSAKSYPPQDYAEKASPGLDQFRATGKLALKVKGNKYIVFDGESQLTKDPVAEDEAKALFKAPEPAGDKGAADSQT